MTDRLDITIGSMPDLEQGQGIDHDTRLVKTALLYGDHARLISPASFLFSGLAVAATSSDPLEILEAALAQIAPSNSVPEDQLNRIRVSIEDLKRVSRKRKLTREDKAVVKRANRLAIELRADALREVRSETPLHGLMELGIAQRRKLLVIDSLDDIWSEEESESLPQWAQRIIRAAGDGTTHMLLDDWGRGILAKAAQASGLEPQSPSVKALPVAQELFARLPMFEFASIADVVDIRKELEAPLTRFKAGLIGFAADIEGEPWDPGFAAEVNGVIVERVAPAVAEIEEATASNSYLKELIIEAGKAAPKTTAGLLGVGVTTALGITAPLAAMMVVGAGATSAAAKAFETWRKQESETRTGNSMYFYYEAGRRL